MEGGKGESEQKTGTRSSFRRHFSENRKSRVLYVPNFPCYGPCEDEIGGSNRPMFLDLNVCAKFRIRSSKASHFDHGSLIKMPSVKYAVGAILGLSYLDY